VAEADSECDILVSFVSTVIVIVVIAIAVMTFVLLALRRDE
jgi:heme/copper-type cytochrome/quinol oxidase subunit 2